MTDTFQTGDPQTTLRNPKLRGDLIHRTVEMNREPMMVCKDPLSRAYYHFTQTEHELLRLADGQRTIQEITAEFQNRYPSSNFEVDAIHRFFGQAAKQGLLDLQNQFRPSASRKRWKWSSLLAIRFPGVNPTKFLGVVSPLTSVLFARPVVIAAVIAAPLCMMAVLMRFDQFASDFALIAENPFGSLFWIAVGIAIAKVLHELAHALACCYLKCECPTIGVMLLLGIPCLYADVSDAWMLKRRSQRMLISAAGMYVECWIAILATLVWIFSNSGPVHDLAVTLMIVCSVSTILINGNPLLRYDGYYLLSDFTGVPNLAFRSRTSLLTRLQSIAGNPTATSDPVWMSVYAAASYLYRYFILASVTMIVFQTLRAMDLELLGIVLLVSTVVVAVFLHTKTLLQAHAIRLVLAGSVLTTALAYPIPRGVVAPMTIIPANAKEIYTTESGFLRDEPRFGEQLAATSSISSLHNPALDRQHAAATASRDRLQTQLQSLQRSRGSQTHSNVMIPALEKDLEQAEGLVDFYNQARKRLDIVPESVGTLYPPMPMYRPSAEPAARLVSDQRIGKVGSWIRAGTPIGVFGDQRHREAILYLLDREIARIQPGQLVTLMIGDAQKGSVMGSVVSIDASPCQDLPESLLESDLIPARSENIYRVRVNLSASSDNLVVHRIGRAKIHANPESIVYRIYRLISETFG